MQKEGFELSKESAMKKSIYHLFLFSLITAFSLSVFTGCGDEDDKDCPDCTVAEDEWSDDDGSDFRDPDEPEPPANAACDAAGGNWELVYVDKWDFCARLNRVATDSKVKVYQGHFERPNGEQMPLEVFYYKVTKDLMYAFSYKARTFRGITAPDAVAGKYVGKECKMLDGDFTDCYSISFEVNIGSFE
jgi:hypothetical protein